jgi:2-phosphosulfolactate phosphatase
MSEVAGISAVVIIVDVLSFTTALDIAISRGASVFPYPLKGESAAAYAASVGASVASARSHQTFSLSPASLQGLPAGYRLVLPSPNGAGLSFNCDHPKVLGACLRNAVAVAAAAVRLGATFAVVPAGEMWPGGELRPAVEDLIGAGAVIASLPGSRSPEAQLAVASFERFRADLSRTLRECSSGKELIDRGFIGDVELAAEYNVSSAVPRLVNRAYAGGEPGV